MNYIADRSAKTKEESHDETLDGPCYGDAGCAARAIRAGSAHSRDIFQWEDINPANPAQGKQQSTTLAPGGAGVSAAPDADLSFRNLTMAYLVAADLNRRKAIAANLTNAELSQANLTNAHFGSFESCDESGCEPIPGANLTNANLSQANLTNANFYSATLIGANLTGAEVRGATFYSLRRRNSTRRPATRPTI